MTTNSAPINETATTEDDEDAAPFWSFDLGDAGTDVQGILHDRLLKMEEDGELGDYYGDDMEALAEYIQDLHCWQSSGTFDQDDLNTAIGEAGDRYIGEDLVEYVGQYLDEDSSPIVAQYAGAIIDAMIHDMKCGGEISEYNGVWFRSY